MNYWPKPEYVVGERIAKYNALAIMHYYTTTGGHFNICKFQLTMLMKKDINGKTPNDYACQWTFRSGEINIESEGTSQGTGTGNGKYVLLLLLTKFFYVKQQQILKEKAYKQIQSENLLNKNKNLL